MSKTLILLICSCSGVLGLLILLRARQFSLRYIEWTAGFSAGQARRKPPPRQAMGERVAGIATLTMRFIGLFVLLLSLMAIFLVWITG